jgi:hypothetical protein
VGRPKARRRDFQAFLLTHFITKFYDQERSPKIGAGGRLSMQKK